MKKGHKGLILTPWSHGGGKRESEKSKRKEKKWKKRRKERKNAIELNWRELREKLSMVGVFDNKNPVIYPILESPIYEFS